MHQLAFLQAGTDDVTRPMPASQAGGDEQARSPSDHERQRALPPTNVSAYRPGGPDEHAQATPGRRAPAWRSASSGVTLPTPAGAPDDIADVVADDRRGGCDPQNELDRELVVPGEASNGEQGAAAGHWHVAGLQRSSCMRSVVAAGDALLAPSVTPAI